MKLLLVAGKNVILVICNKLSKIVAIIEGISVEGLTRLLLWLIPPGYGMD